MQSIALILYRNVWDYDLETGIQEIRYIRTTGLCTKLTVSCFCAGLKFSGSGICANSGIVQSGIRLIDCNYGLSCCTGQYFFV